MVIHFINVKHIAEDGVIFQALQVSQDYLYYTVSVTSINCIH